MGGLLPPGHRNGIISKGLALQFGGAPAAHQLLLGPDLELHGRCERERDGPFR